MTSQPTPDLDLPPDAFALPWDALDDHKARVYVEYYAPAFRDGGWLVHYAEGAGASSNGEAAGSKESAVRKALALAERRGVPLMETAVINVL